MIQFLNEESGVFIQKQHIGPLTSSKLCSYIKQNSQKLRYCASLDESQIMHNERGHYQFLTRNWSMTLEPTAKLLVKVTSNDYLQRLEELINEISRLRDKEKEIEELNNKHFRDRQVSKSLKVTMLYSNPLCVEKEERVGEVEMRYESMYYKEFHEIIARLEKSEKSITLNVHEFNRSTLETAMREKTNILYINAHSEYINGKLNLYGETRQGYLKKFLIDEIDKMNLEPDNVDLILLHSSTSDEFSNKLKGFTKNLVVLCSNVYSREMTIELFASNMLQKILAGKPILTSFNDSFRLIEDSTNMLKTRCCCFHQHDEFCASKAMKILSQGPDIFTRTHKKCHLLGRCKCQNESRLLHKKTCIRVKDKINEEFIPTKIGNQVSYCCCPGISQEFFKTNGVDAHSLKLKLELKKNSPDFGFELAAGQCVSKIKSNGFRNFDIKEDFYLVSSRKSYLCLCLEDIIKKRNEYDRKMFVINFYGEQEDREGISHYLYLLLLRKFMVSGKKLLVDTSYKLSTLSQKIKEFDFIIITEPMQESVIRHRIIEAITDKVTVIIIISKQRVGLLECDILRIGFEEPTQKEKQEILKRQKVRIEPLSYQNKKESSMGTHEFEMNKTNILTKEIFKHIMGNSRLFRLSVALSHFIRLEQPSFDKIIQYESRKGSTEDIEYFVKNNGDLFQNNNDGFRMRKEFKLYFRYYKKFQSPTSFPKIDPQQFSPLYHLLLQQMLIITQNYKFGDENTKLFDMTTLNRYSLLSMYLTDNNYIIRDGTPVLKLDEICSFVKSVVKTSTERITDKQFILLAILVINCQLGFQELSATKSWIELSQEIKKTQNILQISDPLLETILCQLKIQGQLQFSQFLSYTTNEEERNNFVIERMKAWGERLSYNSNIIYHYIVSFDVLMGYVMVYSYGYKTIPEKELEKQGKLLKYLRYYERRRSKAFSEGDKGLFAEISEIHGFKLNFIKMLVNNLQFQVLYNTIARTPSKQMKGRFKGLTLCYKLLKFSLLIKGSPEETGLETLWKWKRTLEEKYRDDNVILFVKGLNRDLTERIRQRTQKVCYILKHFPLSKSVNDQTRTVIIEYQLGDKLRSKGFVVKELPLTKESLQEVVRVRCKYLIFCVSDESTGEGNQEGKVQSVLEESKVPLKECLSVKISNVFVCSTSLSSDLKETFQRFLSPIAQRSLYFSFLPAPETSTQSVEEMEEIILKRKITMNIFIERMIMEGKEALVNEVYEFGQKRFTLEKNCIQQIAESVEGRELVHVDHTGYVVYKADRKQVSEVLGIFNQSRLKQFPGFKLNLFGPTPTLSNFLTFFQKLCLINLNIFREGIYRINCSNIREEEQGISFIEKQLNHDLPWFKNKDCLIILENLDVLLQRTMFLKTYCYLLEIIEADKFDLKIISTSQRSLCRLMEIEGEKREVRVEFKNGERGISGEGLRFQKSQQKRKE